MSVILALGVYCAAEDARPAPFGMNKIPASTLLLGSTLEEVFTVTEHCHKMRPSRPCAPEEFSAELSDGETTQVKPFYLDRQEVSSAAYEHCVRSGQCRSAAYEQSTPAMRSPEHPVILVSHSDAETYCSFRGARLPSEAEFELAARGPERRHYPWGNLFHRGLANAGTFERGRTNASDGFHLLAPVHSFLTGRSPQGVLHLAGNVAEWTSTVFRPHGSTDASSLMVVKGGSFAESPVLLRGAARRAVARGTRSPDIGFRCALSAYHS